MCNLRSHTAGPEAIPGLARVMRDVAGNLPPRPGIFPDCLAPTTRNAPDGERRDMVEADMRKKLSVQLARSFPSPPGSMPRPFVPFAVSQGVGRRTLLAFEQPRR